jgi:flagellar basal-body rod modification protein FlgD
MEPIDRSNALAAPTPSPAQSPSAQAEASSDLGQDAFMKLLVAQLRNQDPLEPMDPQESIAQLAELTSVEQMVSMERRLSAIEVGIAGLANTEVASFVGRTITADTSTLRLDELGQATGAFSLEGPAAEVNVSVRDAEGRLVRTLSLGARGVGAHGIDWDGRNDAGDRLPPGRYALEVEAVDADGNPVEASTRVTDRVTGVTYEDGFAELLLGDFRVVLGDVVSIAP